MALYILRLEDRILFDAAAPAVIAQAVTGQGDGGSGQAPSGAGAADAGEGESGESQPQADGQSESALVDATPATQDAQVNVLLVSSGVENAQQLADSAAGDVIAIVYDENSTLAELQQQIQDALNGRKGDTISFATEGQTGLFFLLKNLSVTSDTLTSNSELANFWKDVGGMLTSDGRVDLLGCFVAGADGNDFGLLSNLDALIDSDGFNRSIAASSDVTGNLPDGNWILEYGNIDASSYFNPVDLAAWAGKLATFTVTTTADSGAGSLRQAVADANAAAGADTIDFAIAANSTISLSSRINLTGDLTIDGKTASGYVFGTVDMVTIYSAQESFRLAGTSAVIQGLHITGADRINPTTVNAHINVRGGSNIIRENVINAFNGSEGCGVLVVAGTNQIHGNYIGTNLSGTASDGSTVIGVQLDGGTNTVGTGLAADRNVFGSGQSAVQSFAGNAVNTIRGNYIGTDSTGTAALQTNSGVVRGASSGATYIIGGTGTGHENVFNSFYGVELATAGSATIHGNYFGTNATGTALATRPSGTGAGIGIYISIAGANTQIGGSAAGAGNIFAGLTGADVNMLFNGASSTQVRGNYFGFDVNGNPLGTGGGGVIVNTGTGILIGGPTVAERNYFAGKTNAAILISSGSATIQNNYIGTNINGDGPGASTNIGISISSNIASTIGGTTSNLRNIISGNVTGISLTNGTHNILGNYIGIDVNGNDLGNTGNGILVNSGTLHNIGNGAATGLNIISGNGGDGIRITGGSASIRGNYIGTDVTGSSVALLGNGSDGIEITSTAASTVGGTNAGDRNIISGNANGIVISGGTQNIFNNYIGTDVAGTTDLGNLGAGIIVSGGSNHAIGATGANGGNLISGNTTNGIQISGTGSAIVRNNTIGLSSAGDVLANSQNGISISSSGASTIGGNSTLGEGNTISGNTVYGVLISNGTQSVYGNMIGTNSAGSLARPNASGIAITGGTNHNIGGSGTGQRNIISGNTSEGILFQGSTGTLVRGNYIGTNSTGLSALGNGANGIWIQSGDNITIGGSSLGQGNVISGNAQGVQVDGGTGLVVQGNIIGRNATNTADLANTNEGIDFDAAGFRSATVGGINAGEGNIISANGGVGVRVNNATGVAIRANSIFLNGDPLGIDLVGTGNAGQVTPTITSAVYQLALDQTIVTFTFDAAVDGNYSFDFFSNPASDGSPFEGRSYQSTYNEVLVAGLQTLSFALAGSFAPGTAITSTATNTSINTPGNTSEFSAGVVVVNNTAPQSVNNTGATVNEGQTITITSANLLYSDAEEGAANVLYEITTPPANGQFESTLVPNVAILSFTQAEIDANQIIYRHFGGENLTDSITFDVSDQVGGEVSGEIFEITVVAQNDAPVEVNNAGVSVDEGTTIAITSVELSYTDAEQPASEILYVLTVLPANGQFESTADPFNALSSFTQEDVNNGLIIYRHYGDENTSDTATFTVQDQQGGEQIGVNFNITINPVNDAPEVGGDLAVSVNEGQSVVISAADLGYTDPDNLNSEITYSVTSTADGYLAFASSPLTAITNFTQQDIIDGTVIFVHDGSETGNGSFQFDVADPTSIPQSNLVTVFVTHSNDAADVTLDFPASLDENTPLDLQDRIIVSDADDQGGNVTVVISVTEGVLNIQPGSTGVTVTNSGLNSTLVGTLAQIADLLAGNNGASLIYNAADAPSANVTFTVDVTDDQGDNTNGTTAVVTINEQNDAADVTLIFPGSIDENTPLDLQDHIIISDADDQGGDISVVISVTEGLLDIQPGTTGVTVTNNGLNSTLVGTLAQIADLLAGNNGASLIYNAADAPSAGVTFTVDVTDDRGEPTAGTATTVTINPENDPFLITAPASFNMLEDDTHDFGNALQISDEDFNNGVGQIKLEVQNGTLTLGDISGLQSVDDQGLVIIITGNQAALNAALNGLQYTPNQDYVGGDNLVVEVDDGVNPPTVTIIAITVDPVNDAPVVNGPSSFSGTEDTSLVLSGISISDVDIINGVGFLEVVLTSTHGTITTTNPALIIAGVNGSASITLYGTFDDVNTAIGALIFIPDSNFNSAEASENATLTVEVSDLGNNPPPAATNARTFDIIIAADNDAPTITVPPAQGTAEDNQLQLQPIVIGDIDSDTVTVIIEVEHGVLTITDSSGVTINDNGSGTVTINGPLTDVNQALEHVLYNPDPNYNGTDNLTITANDGQNNETVVLTDQITIISVNDNPVNSGSNSVVVDDGEGVQIGSNNLNMVDVETPPSGVVYTIMDDPNNGNLTLNGAPLHAGDQFTQENVRNGQIGYFNDGNGESADFVILDVSDGDGGVTSIRFDFNIRLINLLAQPGQLLSGFAPHSYSLAPLERGISFHGNGFFGVQGNNQLTSFGDNMGLHQLARRGDTSMSFSIVNGEPQLSNRARDTGFGEAVSALNYVQQHAGFNVDSADFYQAIEELIDHTKTKEVIQIALANNPPLIAQNIVKRVKG